MADIRSLEDAIRRIIIERLELEIEPSELEPTSDLKRDVGLDSAALLEVVAGLEEVFGFEVDIADVTEENFRNLAGLARYVESRTGGARGGEAC